MKKTLKEKIEMCEEHIIKGKSISHASEMYGGYEIGNLKYLINIYKRYGRDAFLNRENGVYKRDSKLFAFSRVIENKESIIKFLAFISSTICQFHSNIKIHF